MITNIIKNIIKDVPSIADSTLRLFSDAKDLSQFTAIIERKNLLIKITNIPKNPTTVDAYKKRLIADHIYMAANKQITLQEIAATIDTIINKNVVIWDLGE